MQLLISTTSMTPIYEQIVDQIRALIKEGRLKAGEPLDSVRSLARTCRISALTVKKAYAVLEREGLVVSVQGKGRTSSPRSATARSRSNSRRLSPKPGGLG